MIVLYYMMALHIRADIDWSGLIVCLIGGSTYHRIY